MKPACSNGFVGRSIRVGSLEEEAKTWFDREGGGGAAGSEFGRLVGLICHAFPGPPQLNQTLFS